MGLVLGVKGQGFIFSTSHDRIVSLTRRQGVLVIGIGSATKELSGYLKGPKRYRTIGLMGSETDTGDRDGVTISEKAWEHVTEEQLLAALKKHTGVIMQAPPKFSAIKVDGERAYEIARRGGQLVLPERPVEVHAIELLQPWEETKPKFDISIVCGAGTYIRSLSPSSFCSDSLAMVTNGFAEV